MSLADFWADARPFLLGELSAAQLEARHGPSPSGTQNLAFYQPFVRLHERLNLQRLYPEVHILCGRAGLDWAELCEAFIHAHVPSSWSLHRAGEPFGAWLQEQIDAGRPIPAECPALADYSWTRWLALNAPADAPRMDGTVYVRSYAINVVEIRQRLKDDPSAELPEPVPTPMVIYRSFVTGTVRIVGPNLAMLAVLDLDSGQTDTDWAAHGITDEGVAAERLRMQELGMLPADSALSAG